MRSRKEQIREESQHLKDLAQQLLDPSKIDSAFRTGSQYPVDLFNKLMRVTNDVLNEDSDTITITLAAILQKLSIETKYRPDFMAAVVELYLNQIKSEVQPALFQAVLQHVKTDNVGILAESSPELADLKQKAQQVGEDNIKDNIKKAELIERTRMLAAQIWALEDRSPKTKKQWLDQRADEFLELQKELKSAGLVKHGFVLEKLVREKIYEPARESIHRQAEKLMTDLEQAIQSNKTIDDGYLREANKGMVKMLNNLGENPETEELIRRFSELMVKAASRSPQEEKPKAPLPEPPKVASSPNDSTRIMSQVLGEKKPTSGLARRNQLAELSQLPKRELKRAEPSGLDMRGQKPLQLATELATKKGNERSIKDKVKKAIRLPKLKL